MEVAAGGLTWLSANLVCQDAWEETFPQSGSRLLSQPPTLSRICPFSGIILCMG